MAWPFSKRNQLETKEHPSGAAFFVNQAVGWARWSKPRDYIRDGYQMNVLVYRSIKEIVTAATSIKVELYNGEKLVEQHPVLDLLANPTPTMSYREWLTEMLVNRLLIGEQFCVASPEAGRPVEMWPLNPVDMLVQPGRGGIAQAYIHEAGNSKRTYMVDPMTGLGPCFYSKLYNPADYWRGQSPLMAASLAADTHNAGGKWNFNLLRNSAKPSGLVRFKNAYPSGDVIQKMREYFKKQMQGADNAGEVPMLADDAEWVQLSQTALDMDFSTTMASMAKQIASAYGVPLPLIDNDASTFNNLEQAKERLYTDTVIPLMQDFLGALSRWLFPMFNLDGYELRLDMDSIPALEGLRQKMFDRAERMYTAGILTLEESRILIGYEETPKGVLKADPTNELPLDDVKALVYGAGFERK